MIPQRIRRTVAALALLTTFAVVAPVHATGWIDRTGGPGLIEQALEWVARLWVGEGGATGAETLKCGMAINPDGCPGAALLPEPPPSANSTGGSNPKG